MEERSIAAELTRIQAADLTVLAPDYPIAILIDTRLSRHSNPKIAQVHISSLLKPSDDAQDRPSTFLYLPAGHRGLPTLFRKSLGDKRFTEMLCARVGKNALDFANAVRLGITDENHSNGVHLSNINSLCDLATTSTRNDDVRPTVFDEIVRLTREKTGPDFATRVAQFLGSQMTLEHTNTAYIKGNGARIVWQNPDSTL